MSNLPRLENLTDLANLLRSIDNSETSEMGFDMNYGYLGRYETPHECGSACCISGWVAFCNPETKSLSLHGAVQTLGAQIVECEALNLCYPDGESEDAYNATPEQAARAVEILRDTGKCDWPRAMSEGDSNA